MDNKLPENDIRIENGFAKKLENFWYYHKWKVIAVTFIAVVFGFCVYSCAAKPKIDITLLYAGPYSSVNTAVPKMNETLSSVMPESVGKDGAALNILDVYSEEQAMELAKKSVGEYIEEEKKYGRYYSTEERESLVTQQFNRYAQINTDHYSKIGSYLGMGTYLVCLLDPEVYETYRANDIFVQLSTVFGDDIPESAYSEDAILLSETSIYKNDPNGIGQLPKDTLLCLRMEPLFSGCSGDNSENYEKALDMFRAMVK